VPSGYTSKLHDGEQTFEEFVWDCARAMDASVELRDEPHGTPLGDLVPGTYHLERLELDRRELLGLRVMPVERAAELAVAEHAAAMARWRSEHEEMAARMARYREMRAMVEAWEPPSDDHEGLKEFMLGQLIDSIRVDCTMMPAPEVPLDGETWLVRRRNQLIASIAYHEKAHAVEVARVAERNAWNRTLAASVRPPWERGT
jgi:hypothetical protein